MLSEVGLSNYLGLVFWSNSLGFYYDPVALRGPMFFILNQCSLSVVAVFMKLYFQ